MKYELNSIFPTPVYTAEREYLDSAEKKEIEDIIKEGMFRNSGNSTSNNSDIFNGKLKELKQFFNLDDVFVCYSDNNNYFRRKPNSGMIIEAQKKWKIDLKKSYLIGDRKKDIEAGLNVGLKTIFLDENYKEPKPINYHFKIKNLNSVKKIIIK